MTADFGPNEREILIDAIYQDLDVLLADSVPYDDPEEDVVVNKFATIISRLESVVENMDKYRGALLAKIISAFEARKISEYLRDQLHQKVLWASEPVVRPPAEEQKI